MNEQKRTSSGEPPPPVERQAPAHGERTITGEALVVHAPIRFDHFADQLELRLVEEDPLDEEDADEDDDAPPERV